MGLDISKITNAELQMLAYENDSERAEDINILIGEEFTKFRKAALDWAKSKNTAEASEAVRQTLGLYMTQPAATTEVVETKQEEKVEAKPDKKAEKKEKEIKKEDQNAIKEDVKNLVKNALNGKDTQPVDLSTVVARLKEDNSNPVYTDAIKEVEELVAAIQGKNYNSKNEVEALEKNIKDAYTLSKFQKDILGDLVKLAKEDQINKEANELKRLYDNHIRNTKGATNYNESLKTMKEKMEKEWYLKDNSYYSNEAFKKFEAGLKKEIAEWAEKEMEAMTAEGDKDIDKDYVIDTVKNKLANKDDFAKDVVGKMKNTATTSANRVNRERTREELKSISDDELRKELEDKTYRLLRANILKEGSAFDNGDGTYDLSTLSDAIRSVIGAEEEMNTYGDYKRSEVQAAIDELKDMLDRGDLQEAQMHDLKELCNIKDAPKSRKAEDIFGNAKDEAIGGALIGAALSAAKIENIAIAVVEGFAESTAKQVIRISPAIAIPGVAAAEIAVDALVKAIIGVKKPEETCFNYEYAEGKTIGQYLDKLKDTADSKEQYNAIAILAKLYANKYGEGWNTEFVNDMKNAAGGDSALNCREFNSAYNGLIEKLKKTEEVKVVKKDPELKNQKEEITTTKSVAHDWKAGQSWQAMILAHYPDAFDGLNQKQVYAIIKPFVDEFRRSQGIGFRQGLPVNQKVVFKPITVNGKTYHPVQADEETIKNCTSKKWFGYDSPYFTANWGIPTEGTAKVNGDEIYTATRKSDGVQKTDKDEKAAQDALIPAAEKNVKTEVTITNTDGTTRKVIVDPEK